ncbi:TetR/AcrR family transcriptional regulator [Streptomyces sp. NPDC088116]|uniref:TetR/AcrR family transcriptional regulator n=1 Tax=Streptomyces sp. NPDC088116 TaxID=3365825 RepID=UPI00381041FA
MSDRTARADRVAETREAIMSAAERLFAEHGLIAVSNRQIGEAAGQGNVTAVSYHFGAKAGLVRAVMSKHSEKVERIRQRHLDEIGDSHDLRDWVGCLVRPVPEHLGSLGIPSWYARFAVQVMTDPLMRAMTTDEALTREPLRQTLDGLGRLLEAVPAPVRVERGAMARHLIVHTCAERERALAEGTALLHSSWERTADALTDAIVGLLTAPVSPHHDLEPNRP